jgi:diguanylate cyclase (GGDEF)-like protein
LLDPIHDEAYIVQTTAQLVSALGEGRSSQMKTENQLSDKITHHFLQTLIALTKERDMLELEHALKDALTGLMHEISQSEVRSVQIYYLRDISKMFFDAVGDGVAEDPQRADVDFCEKLMSCYNSGSYECFQPDTQEGLFHLFPLKKNNAYNNAVIVVHAGTIDQVSLDAICQLLAVYQNYIGLLNDNERDTLTGLLNRKTFDFRINKILTSVHQTSLRKQDRDIEAYYLTIFDIDHFKRVNDEFGHLIGDEVLLLFSQLMTKSFRDTDPLFRFGGEEFVAIFACADENDIQGVLARFTQRLADFSFPQVGKVTVSIGCARLSADSTPTQLVDRADLALYYAKNNGRNQVRYYETLLAEGHLKEEVIAGDIELF